MSTTIYVIAWKPLSTDGRQQHHNIIRPQCQHYREPYKEHT